MRRSAILLIVTGCIGLILLSSSSSSSLVSHISPYTSGSDPPIVLVTGFEPFGVYEVNPSQLIAEALHGQYLDEVQIIGLVLPVDFEDSVEILIGAIEDYSPILVISTGLSARAHSIVVEKCGVNLKRLPRNETLLCRFRRVDPMGPLFRFTPLCVRGIVGELRTAGISAKGSLFAGFYVCNAVFYRMLGYLMNHTSSIQGGFIHVPLLKEQDPQGMELDMMVEAVEIAIRTCLV